MVGALSVSSDAEREIGRLQDAKNRVNRLLAPI